MNGVLDENTGRGVRIAGFPVVTTTGAVSMEMAWRNNRLGSAGGVAWQINNGRSKHGRCGFDEFVNHEHRVRDEGL